MFKKNFTKILPVTSLLLMLATGRTNAAGEEINSQEDPDNGQTEATIPLIRKSAYWGNWQEMPLERRVMVAPTEVIEFLRQDNQRNGIADRPEKAEISAELLADIKKALNDLPAVVKKKLESKLAAIVLVDHLGGTGFSDSIVDDNRAEIGGYTVFDAKAIDRKANEWASWKENTPFIADPSIRIRLTIENPADDNRVQTIQFMLLHEGAHIISVGENFHPSWNKHPNQIKDTERFAFFNSSWQVDKDKNKYIPRSEWDFTLRPLIVYYFGAKLSAAQASHTYQALLKRPFVSLYALVHPADDFAESFAIYVHKELQKKPWHIEITSDTGTPYSYEPSWSDSRLSAKLAIIKDFLEP